VIGGERLEAVPKTIARGIATEKSENPSP